MPVGISFGQHFRVRLGRDASNAKDTRMAERRDIDERDIDRLLAALTDTQIASVFGMSEAEVYKLRQSRQKKPPQAQPEQKSNGKTKP